MDFLPLSVAISDNTKILCVELPTPCRRSPTSVTHASTHCVGQTWTHGASIATEST
jgi:hypothetical protein